MSTTQINAQARHANANRTMGRSTLRTSGADAQRSNHFPTGNFYNNRWFGGVSRRQIELLRHANLQVLRMLTGS